MRRQDLQPIMGAKMSIQSSDPHQDGVKHPHDRDAEVTRGSRRSTSITVTVCGDSIVGRALVLLLQDYEYDVGFLPVASLDEMVLPDGTQLLLLTPDLSVERGEILSALLGDRTSGKEIPTLELVAASETKQNEEARNWSEHLVPWPCSTESLKRRIEAALFGDPGMEDNRKEDE